MTSVGRKLHSSKTPGRWTGWLGLIIFFVLLQGLTAPEEKPGSKKAPETKKPAEEPSFTFKVPVDVVVVNATVTDKKGNPVKDLTVDDFKVYEDGKPQRIHTFSLETYRATLNPSPAEVKPGQEVGPNEAPAATLPRFTSFFIDDLTASTHEYYYRMTEAIRKFVENDLTPMDQLSLLTASGRVQVPFTNDKALLLQELGSLYKKFNMSAVTKSSCPRLTDLQAQNIFNQVQDYTSLQVAIEETIACMQLDRQAPGTAQIAEQTARSAASAEFNETQYRNRRLLQTLRQHIRSLRHYEARKSIILFSDGFLFRELTYELQQVVDAALRAGVVINALDLRGLYTASFQASDDLGSVGPELIGKKQSLFTSDAMAQAEPLEMMAHDTGGIIHERSNDFYAGLQRISNRQAFLYVLTYATPSSKSDGRYHKIKLEVSRPGLEISYRKGYYAPKEELSFETRKKEDIMEALQASGNMNEIPVGFSYNYYQLDDSRYEVALLTQVDIRQLHFLDEESRHKNLISLVVVALDENDRYIDGSEKTVDFSLTGPSYAELLNRGFTSKVNLRLPPGRYKIKTVVRESVQSKMGSLTKAIEIP